MLALAGVEFRHSTTENIMSSIVSQATLFSREQIAARDGWLHLGSQRHRLIDITGFEVESTALVPARKKTLRGRWLKYTAVYAVLILPITSGLSPYEGPHVFWFGIIAAPLVARTHLWAEPNWDVSLPPESHIVFARINGGRLPIYRGSTLEDAQSLCHELGMVLLGGGGSPLMP